MVKAADVAPDIRAAVVPVFDKTQKNLQFQRTKKVIHTKYLLKACEEILRNSLLI